MLIAAQKIDDLLELNSNWLSKNGFLKPGGYSISWSNSYSKASAHITTLADSIEFRFQTGLDTVVQEIDFEWAKCGAGGRRAYLRCPECGKRCYKLFFSESRWVCRHCTGLLYRVQVEEEADQALRRSKKLRERLGAPMMTGAPVEKPKGMHWQTFFQLYGRLIREEECLVGIEIERLRMKFSH